ncbi:MAG: arginine deiminase family protein [Blastocatellia bacterium]|nr:arginine deiminase family protein [Blastocatellia bacterium]
MTKRSDYMLMGITRAVSPAIADCELTFLEREPIDYARAARQHGDYCDALRELGVKVIELAADASQPDCCFVEDTAIVTDEIAVIANPGAASRRGEIPAIEMELAKHRKLAHIQSPATIEGGDVLQIGKKIFVGLSSRTNRQGFEELARILTPFGYSVLPVKIEGSLHLKSTCTALDDETLLVSRQSLALEPFAGFNLLFVSEDEPWAANALRISDTVCLQADSPKTAEIVRRVCGKIRLIDMSELRKAEAGLTCSSIIFQEAV